ncbi:M14 family metallopeptidase [Muriicola marianensis]|uniref:Peptidase M14 n=1 Tax=Muriicola marianensis TaxID=1324801 RepID=A0ABQ1QQF4_9FLAO|nr:M14 metallopeptidase family protein [Muriicola marianensis]GGD38350.1 peptidase M14 [Muriicola marianensis]
MEGQDYNVIREGSVKGRYLSPEMLHPILEFWGEKMHLEKIGNSVMGRPIQKIVLGTGPIKVMMWSQMHGNESTTTKAVLDLVKALHLGYRNSGDILESLTLVIIPQLNPDGAEAYTRENAAGIDLNRDARNQTQPESIVLSETFREHKPDFCFNLHDQRTIFSAGPGPHPATLSFLSPAADTSRSVTASRLTAMQIISGINRELQAVIPGQIGRYDDAFNPNCVGDTFQMQQTPTLLFEAGHFAGDYEREKTRQYVFTALWTALDQIVAGRYREETQKGYEDIPENQKKFFDILIRNAQVLQPDLSAQSDAGILYREELRSGSIHFSPEIEKQGDLSESYGHVEYDCIQQVDLEKLRSLKEITVLFPERKR